MNKRKPYIDKRLDWRDPDMPVLVRVIVGITDNNVKLINYQLKSPAVVREYYARKMVDPTYNPPEWFEDETYDLKNNLKKLKNTVD